MTRLELLLAYPLNKRRDTWLQLGQAETEADQKVFIRGTLLRVTQPVSGTPLHGCVIFVDEDFTDSEFSWEGYTVEDLSKGYIIKNHIIHPHLFIILTQAQFQSITDPYDPTFIPYSDEAEYAPATIKITEDEMNIIFIEAGVPFIRFEELEFTRTQFIDNVIRPVVQEYYKWFPNLQVVGYPLSTNEFTIPVPEGAYAAHRVYVNPGYPISRNVGNPISRYFDEVILSTSSQGSFANPSLNWKKRQGFVNTQSFSTFILERAVRQGVINYGARTRVHVDHIGNFIKGYSNKMGMLEVEWAYASDDWNDIPYNRKSEARELATARALRALGMLRTQVKATDMGTIEYTRFFERADTLEEKVITLWREAAKVMILRGN